MNQVIQTIKQRRSCRDFKSDMLPDDVIQQICEAGTFAPTGMNRQSPIIIAVKDKDLRDKLSIMNAQIMGKENFDPFYNAPVILIVLADKTAPTYLYDGSLVMQNLMLANLFEVLKLDYESLHMYQTKYPRMLDLQYEQFH